ncbi:hypothetical protein [Orrella sp. 11846]|uniref:hypothetical protein n=1 Tax=Orrella sp. 11846 TaxID=3409913 RepID=UPI003B5A24DD
MELILTDCHNRLGMSQAALKSVEQAYGLIEFYGTNSLYAAALCQEAVALHALGQSQSAFERWQRAIVESRSLGLSVFSQRAQRQLDAAMRGAPVI